MPPTAAVPDDLRRSVFRGSKAVRRGVLTPNQLRGPAWRRLFEDVYVHADRPVTHALRARAAAGLVVPGAVVTGRSAAVLWGVPLAAADDVVELTIPPSSHPRRVPGIRVRRARLPDGAVVRHRDVRVATPVCTAVRLAASLPGDEGVMAVDQFVDRGLADLEAVRALAASACGAGSARARMVCALADGLAGSPQETHLRLIIARSSLPPVVAQVNVRDDFGLVGRVDFAWPQWKVAIEYDGLWHAEDGQFARDRRRLNRLHAAGWRVFFVTAADLYEPERLVDRLVEFMAGAVVR